MVNVVTLAPAGLFGLGISEANQKKIKSVSRKINLIDGSVLLGEEQKGNLANKAKLDAMLSDAEILLARALPKEVIKRSPKLKWIQMMYAGMEVILRDKDLVESPAKLTNASGIQAEAIAEYAITLMLAFNKRLLHFAELKKQHVWQPATMPLFASQTVGVIGLGNIGHNIAKRAKALGARVIGYDRPRKIPRAQYVDEFVTGNGINKLFKESDFVISAVPSTPATNGLVSEKMLALMKPTAYLMNISRGAIVDEKAVIQALKEKRIAGAGMDVFATEPLPKDSPLWDFPNTILSPHCCGRIDDNDDRVTDMFVENLKRFVDDKRLFNVVDKQKGF